MPIFFSEWNQSKSSPMKKVELILDNSDIELCLRDIRVDNRETRLILMQFGVCAAHLWKLFRAL